jgi:hypothetical protein
MAFHANAWTMLIAVLVKRHNLRLCFARGEADTAHNALTFVLACGKSQISKVLLNPRNPIIPVLCGHGLNSHQRANPASMRDYIQAPFASVNTLFQPIAATSLPGKQAPMRPDMKKLDRSYKKE